MDYPRARKDAEVLERLMDPITPIHLTLAALVFVAAYWM